MKSKEFNTIRETLKNKRPRFLIYDENDTNFVAVDVDHIIQTLYDMVDIKGKFDECLRAEHEFSILKQYKFNPFMVKIGSNEELKAFLSLAEHFKELYDKVANTMETEMIERLLKKYKLINEGELFCSNFTFRFSEEKSCDFIGILGKSNEET